jgi:hypothetical protein
MQDGIIRKQGNYWQIALLPGVAEEMHPQPLSEQPIP